MKVNHNFSLNVLQTVKLRGNFFVRKLFYILLNRCFIDLND